jgi:hypothetical protein
MKIAEKLRNRSLDVTVPALIVLIGAALPWGRSGEEDRSSFELIQVARRLDVLEGPAATIAWTWLVLPLLVAGIAVAGTHGRRRLALGVGTGVAVAAVLLVVAVHRSPLLPRYGLHVTLAGVVVLAVAGVGAITGSGVGAAARGPHGTGEAREPRT